jgi:hypothetical protein
MNRSRHIKTGNHDRLGITLGFLLSSSAIGDIVRKKIETTLPDGDYRYTVRIKQEVVVRVKKGKVASSHVVKENPKFFLEMDSGELERVANLMWRKK